MTKKILKFIPILILTLFLISCNKKIPIKEAPTVLLNPEADYFTITYNLTVFDDDKVLNLISLELFQDTKLINTLTNFKITDFINLNSNTNYKLVLKYEYDLNDDEGLIEKVIEKNIKTKEIDVPTVNVEFLEITPTEVDFILNTTNSKYITKLEAIELFSDSKLITTITNLKELQFKKLDPKTAYNIKILYKYNLSDGLGEQELIYELPFETIAYRVPKIILKDLELDLYSITYNYDISDIDKIFKEITSIKLYQDEELITDLEDLTVKTFSDLDYNTEYKLVITYTYMPDELITKTSEFILKTKDKQVPLVNITNIEVEDVSISFDLEVIDEEEYGGLTNYKLYKDEELLYTSTNFEEFEITNLSSNTIYRLEILYTYDLDDGEGEKEIIFKKLIKTKPAHINVTSVTLLNSTTPEVGEEVHLRIEFANADDLKLQNIYLNEEKINIYRTESKTSILIRYKPKFIGGIYEIEVTGFSYILNNKLIIEEISKPFKQEILIVEKMDVIDIYNEDEDGIFVIGEENNLYIKLENVNEYEIIGLTLTIDGKDEVYTSADITIKAEDLILIPYKKVLVFNLPNNRIQYETNFILKSIKYGNNEHGYISKAYDLHKSMFIVKDKTLRAVTTMNELANLEDGYIYELKEDLDASGYNWTPYDFTGVLYGNDKTIDKFSYTIENDDSNAILGGLFTNLNGLISNLTLENLYLSVKGNNEAYVGSIAGNMNGILDNVNLVDATIYLESQGTSYLGGLAGKNNGVIKNSQVDNTIIDIINNKNNAQIYIGGLTGTANDIINSSVKETSLTINTNTITTIGALAANVNNVIGSYIEKGSINIINSNEVRGSSLVGILNNEIKQSYVKDHNVIINALSKVTYGGLVSQAYTTLRERYINDSYTFNLNVEISTLAEANIIYGGISGNGGIINRTNVFKNIVTINAQDELNLGSFIGNILESSSVSNSLVLRSKYTINNAEETHTTGYTNKELPTTNTYINDFEVIINESYYPINIEIIGLLTLNDENFFIETLKYNKDLWDLTNLNYLKDIIPIFK